MILEQLTTGLTFKDKQPSTFTFTPADLTRMSLETRPDTRRTFTQKGQAGTQTLDLLLCSHNIMLKCSRRVTEWIMHLTCTKTQTHYVWQLKRQTVTCTICSLVNEANPKMQPRNVSLGNPLFIG